MNINLKFILLGGQVVYCCAGTFTLLKLCMIRPQRRQLEGCGLDSDCVASSIAQLALIFACQVLNKEFDITEEENVQQATS